MIATAGLVGRGMTNLMNGRAMTGMVMMRFGGCGTGDSGSSERTDTKHNTKTTLQHRYALLTQRITPKRGELLRNAAGSVASEGGQNVARRWKECANPAVANDTYYRLYDFYYNH